MGNAGAARAIIRRHNAELTLPLAQEHLLEIARGAEARARSLASTLTAVEAGTHPGFIVGTPRLAAKIADELAQAVRDVEEIIEMLNDRGPAA